MAVHFPRLALEALRISPDSRDAVGIIDGQGRNAAIVDCTYAATLGGVVPGLGLHAALVLSPDLQVLERDSAREQAALIKLAETGYSFTPTVSIENPGSLLLEVEGSAHLFGGHRGIRSRAKDVFKLEGFNAFTALAPTPLAALWFAKARQEVCVARIEDLRSLLGRLPVTAVTWLPEQQDAFARLGIQYLVDLFRLPRDGMAKRFGTEFLKHIDRALGDVPDPRTSWTLPKRVRLTRELPGELSQMGYLQPYIDNMLAELITELRSHDAAVDRLKIVFKHWQQVSTAVTVGSAIPHRDVSRWNTLIQNHLANQALTAPVLELQLLSGRFKRYTAQSQDLLGISQKAGENISELVDILRSRLGRTAVYGVAMTQDARPEQAWRSVEPGVETIDPREHSIRPINVLSTPLPLQYSANGLRYRGATLKLVKGPERIDGGWWSKESWIRDYYQALSSRGERLWIFHQNKQWYLHGLFS